MLLLHQVLDDPNHKAAPDVVKLCESIHDFAIAAYLGKSDEFDRQLGKFARTYADQNESDYARFMQALEAGEL